MKDLNKIKKFFERDRFVKICGIEIISVGEGTSECSLKISDMHLNSADLVQGGAIYTLADFAFAVAANSEGRLTLTMNNNISYLRPAKGTTLIAKAKKISSTTSTCLYEVEVTDELNTYVAHATVNGFIKDIKTGL